MNIPLPTPYSICAQNIRKYTPIPSLLIQKGHYLRPVPIALRTYANTLLFHLRSFRRGITYSLFHLRPEYTQRDSYSICAHSERALPTPYFICAQNICKYTPNPSAQPMILVVLIYLICSIVNLALSEGVVIDKSKHAVVSPLIKKPSLDAEALKNYRPVSGLNLISKTIKRVVSKQLKHHLTVNDLDNINQSAYKTNHSTETALLKITGNVKMNLAQNKPTSVVLLDLSAAFDTIDHQQQFDELSSKCGLSLCS